MYLCEMGGGRGEALYSAVEWLLHCPYLRVHLKVKPEASIVLCYVARIV